MKDRQFEILNLLKERRFLTVSQISKQLHYSQSTIRRDLQVLENADFLERFHGGALLLRPDEHEMPTDIKANLHTKEKNYIASLASKHIKDNQVIFLDGSSTSNILAQSLLNFQNLFIATTNMSTAIYLSKNSNNKILALGGIMTDVISTSTLTLENISHYVYDIAFISCRGLDKKMGITERLESESIIKRYVANNSKSTILLADNSKFGKILPFKDCEYNQIHSLITNQLPSSIYRDLFKKNNIELIY